MSNILLKLSVSRQVGLSDNNQRKEKRDQANLRHIDPHREQHWVQRVPSWTQCVAASAPLLAISHVFPAHEDIGQCQLR